MGKKRSPEPAPTLPFLLVDGIHHMDSLEGMRALPDASVDLVITSPPYADMKVYEGGFNGFHPDVYVRWFLPYVSEIARILKPTGSFILNINDKVVDTFRHPFLFELIYAIHNPEKYARAEQTEMVPMHGLRLYERLFWNKGKYLANPHRFGDKLEYLFWFSKTKQRKVNMDAMRMEYDEKSVKRMERPLIKRFTRESGEEVTEYKDGGAGSWQPNPEGALPSTLVEEGAMRHVRPIVETFEEGTAVLLDNLGEGVFHAVWPTAGSSPHPSTLVTIGSETRRILGSHVAVYPERLVSYFIQGATDEGDVVLDPFSGTGTTAVVAKALGRRYIAFDISEEYVEFGSERLKRGPYLEELKDQPTPSATRQQRWDVDGESSDPI
jgi:site-specific DNA-methyltransferase (adenine-specific)